jgi:hypothetical protein
MTDTAHSPAASPDWLSAERPKPKKRRNPRRDPKLKDPAAKRSKGGLPCLADPNYYRMAYQLAVELIKNPGEDPKAPDPKTIVKQLLDDADLMITWYKRREYLGEGQWWKRLDSQEKALLRFLEETIVPCLQIIRAVIDPEPDPPATAAEVKRQVKILREEADTRKLAYRPLYNFAWYEAEESKKEESRKAEDDEAEEKAEQAHTRAVTYLLAAVRKAPARRRKALLERADHDKSLESVVDDAEFQAERKVFDPPASPASSSAPPLNVWTRLRVAIVATLKRWIRALRSDP